MQDWNTNILAAYRLAGTIHTVSSNLSVVHVVQLHKDPLPNAFGHVDNIFDTAADDPASTFGMPIDDFSATAAAAAPGRDPLLQGQGQAARLHAGARLRVGPVHKPSRGDETEANGS